MPATTTRSDSRTRPHSGSSSACSPVPSSVHSGPSRSSTAGSVIVNRSSNYRLDSFVYGGIKQSGCRARGPALDAPRVDRGALRGPRRPGVRPIHVGASGGVRDRRALVVGDHGHDGRSRLRARCCHSTTRSAPCRSRTSCSCCGPVARRPPWSAPSSTLASSPRSITARFRHRRSPPGPSLRPEPGGCPHWPPASSLSDRSMAPRSRQRWSCSPNSGRTRIRQVGPRGSSTGSVQRAGEFPGVGHRWHQRDRRAERLLDLASTVGGGRAAAAERAIGRRRDPSLRSGCAGEHRRRACGGADRSGRRQPSSATSHSPCRGPLDLPRTSSKRRPARDRCD